MADSMLIIDYCYFLQCLDQLVATLEEKRILMKNVQSFMDCHGISLANMTPHSELLDLDRSVSIFGEENDNPIDGGSNTLDLCFTKLDPKDMSREFVLSVSLKSDDYNDLNHNGMFM